MTWRWEGVECPNFNETHTHTQNINATEGMCSLAIVPFDGFFMTMFNTTDQIDI